MYAVCTETALPSLTTTIFPLRSAKVTVVGCVKPFYLEHFLVWIGWASHSLSLSLTHPLVYWEEWSELEIFEGGMVCCISVLVV
jgi:hypothetical protein